MKQESKKSETIAVVAYGRVEFWNDRQKALSWWSNAAAYCDGAEAERYWTIVSHLLDGAVFCNDNYDRDPVEECLDCIAHDSIRTFDGGSHFRCE